MALGRALDDPNLCHNRCGQSNDVKAAVDFTKKMSETCAFERGHDAFLNKNSGFTETQMLEIVLLVGLNFLIQLCDEAVATDDDVPGVTADST